ncbi:MAG TPA: tyrosine-type recombinase/integrase [Solirubrobacterales bacterium]|jgi:integrase|nr:tyrosine-type recombinase/integrase [Solirubrobacterales bacterium]
MRAATHIDKARKTVDTSTRYDGVYARHQLRCAKALDKGRRCSCTPSYYGKVWDPAIGRYRVTTPRRPNLLEAKGMRDDLLLAVRTGTVVDAEVSAHRTESPTFAVAHTEFIEECKEGVARTKKGRRYTKKSIKSLDSGLRRVPEGIRGREMSAITQGELQRMVDGFLRGPKPLSGERIATIVNAIRSLYRWAVGREKASENPAALVAIPVDASQTEHRIATPGEFAELLDAIPAEDALAWAIAGYATARHQEIEALDWADVDFAEKTVLLGEDEEARKSEAARRIVLMVGQLRVRMHAEWVRQGRPESGPIFRSKRADNRSGTADLNAVLRRITKRWTDLGLVPISFQDSRHTAATWLDHAGVSPKVSSVIMGHKAPKLREHPDAAPITLRRYTHVLEGELERACTQLQTFLDEREAEEREAQTGR